MGNEIGRFTKIIDRNYPPQQSINLFYPIQLIIHHLQVVPHENIFRLDLIINTLLSIKTIKTSQIQMTYTHV